MLSKILKVSLKIKIKQLDHNFNPERDDREDDFMPLEKAKPKKNESLVLDDFKHVIIILVPT